MGAYGEPVSYEILDKLLGIGIAEGWTYEQAKARFRHVLMNEPGQHRWELAKALIGRWCKKSGLPAPLAWRAAMLCPWLSPDRGPESVGCGLNRRTPTGRDIDEWVEKAVRPAAEALAAVCLGHQIINLLDQRDVVGTPQQWAALAMVAKDRTASRVAEIDWVARHIALPVAAIDPAQVPSPTALALLQHVKTDPTERGKYWQSLYAKLLPKQADIDRGNQQQDDGRAVENIDKLLAIAAAARGATAGRAAEPAGPEPDDDLAELEDDTPPPLPERPSPPEYTPSPTPAAPDGGPEDEEPPAPEGEEGGDDDDPFDFGDPDPTPAAPNPDPSGDWMDLIEAPA